jgi:hypothetical protein
MNAVDEFLYSVRGVFAQNRATDWTELGVLLACAIVVISSLTVWLTRRRSQRALAVKIAGVVQSARLSTRDVAFLTQISRAAGLVVFDVMTRLPAFERATAGALAALSPILRPDEGSAFERVRQLRKILGFSPLPAHHWLGSTRELVNGDPITLAMVTTPVVAVNEASFAVDLPMSVAPVRGAEVAMTLVRQEDSRYLTRVRVLAVEAIPVLEADAGPTTSVSGGGARGRRVFFAHDEQPERQQHREHVRVRVQGPVVLRIEGEPQGASGRAAQRSGTGIEGASATAAVPTAAASFAELSGTLVDVSAGGLALDLHLPAQEARRAVGGAGARVRCAFELGTGAAFEDVAAHVVALETKPGARVQRMRLSFHLSDGERDRLAAAVARHQRGLADGGVV